MRRKPKSISPTMTREEAVDLVSGDYGQETLRHIASYVAPIFWISRASDGTDEIHNGSIFFVDAGGGLFAVTANHVLEGYKAAKAANTNTSGCQIVPNTFDGPGRETVPFDLQARLIDRDEAADIATFQVLPEEMDAIGSTILTT